MKKTLSVAGIVFALALIAPAFAGEGECEHETQVCLDYLAKMGSRGYAGIDLDAGMYRGGSRSLTRQLRPPRSTRR